MSVVDEYLLKFEKEKRQGLQRIREIAKKIIPDSEETISYAMPALTYKGIPFLGFDARKNHIGIYPYSGQVIENLKDKLAPYEFSKGAIRVPYDKPISEGMLKMIIEERIKLINNS